MFVGSYEWTMHWFQTRNFKHSYSKPFSHLVDQEILYPLYQPEVCPVSVVWILECQCVFIYSMFLAAENYLKDFNCH